MAYWLMKSEPSVFGIDHLAQRQVALWDGVRNYQARNFLRQMQIGDQAFFYHSNCKVAGIVGLMTIARGGYADPHNLTPNINTTTLNPNWIIHVGQALMYSLLKNFTIPCRSRP
jgi:predicted RNA-binding protein with PUA-like domain